MKQFELLHQPESPILVARLVLAIGSRVDPPGQRGRQQLLAGVLTRGCGELNAEDFANKVESFGASLRCDAGDDFLVIALKCNNDDAIFLLPLLLDMLESPSCDKDQVNLERDLNIQTIQRMREDPFYLCHEKLRLLLFSDGPYGHDPIGIKNDLEKIEPKLLLQISKQLSARSALLVLAGNPSLSLQEQCINRISGWTSEIEAGPPLIPEPLNNFAAVRCRTEQVVMMIGFRTVEIQNPDALLLRILQVHLGVGMSCRLFHVIREELGLAYDIGAELITRSSDSPMIWHLSCGIDRAPEALSAFLGEWRRLLEQPISAAELNLAVAKIKGQEALSCETLSQRADRLAALLSYGLPKNHSELCLKKLPHISPEELQQAAQRLLQKPNLSVCGPASALNDLKHQWQVAMS